MLIEKCKLQYDSITSFSYYVHYFKHTLVHTYVDEIKYFFRVLKCVYGMYSVYNVYCVYSVYNVFCVYNVYCVYSVYSVYSIRQY